MSMCEENESSMYKDSDNVSIEISYNVEELIAGSVDDMHNLSIPSDYEGFKARLDTLVPLIGDAVAAIPGKDVAIVRFPVVDGKQLCWNDLLNRKTPGWENWKQLGGFNKDGKFNPQAAIKKAGLKSNPAAVANLVLQGAAVVVGQAYMTEISNKLESIESGIASIERMLERDKEAQLDGNFRALRRYTANLEDNSLDPQKKQAVIGSLEHIRTDTLKLWSYQVKALEDFKQEVSKPGRIDAKKAESVIDDLRKIEETTSAAFQLLMLIEQTSMQYDNDFSEKRLNKAKEEVKELIAEFQVVNDDVCRQLRVKIDKVKGLSPIAVAKRRELIEEPANILDGMVKNVGEVAERITPIALIDEGKRQKETKKKELLRELSSGDDLEDVLVEHIDRYERLNFMFNEADGLLVSEDEIYFIKKNNE